MTIVEFLEARIAEDEAAADGAGWNGDRDSAYDRDNYGYLLVDPSRVLRECAAKRALIEEAKMNGCSWCDDGPDPGILEPLAAVYADHPDYGPAWRMTSM